MGYWGQARSHFHHQLFMRTSSPLASTLRGPFSPSTLSRMAASAGSEGATAGRAQL